MLEEIDNILNDYYLGKYDLIEVRQKMLALYGKYLSSDKSCSCNPPHIYYHADLTSVFCVKCGKNVRSAEDVINTYSECDTKELVYKAFMARTDEEEYAMIHRRSAKDDFEKWWNKNKK